MPCYVCNPQCGRCRPSRPRAVKCPVCGKLNAFSYDELESACCEDCGEPFPLPELVSCDFTGKFCRVPCVRVRKKPELGKQEPCPWNHAFDL